MFTTKLKKTVLQALLALMLAIAFTATSNTDSQATTTMFGADDAIKLLILEGYTAHVELDRDSLSDSKYEEIMTYLATNKNGLKLLLNGRAKASVRLLQTDDLTYPSIVRFRRSGGGRGTRNDGVTFTGIFSFWSQDVSEEKLVTYLSTNARGPKMSREDAQTAVDEYKSRSSNPQLKISIDVTDSNLDDITSELVRFLKRKNQRIVHDVVKRVDTAIGKDLSGLERKLSPGSYATVATILSLIPEDDDVIIGNIIEESLEDVEHRESIAREVLAALPKRFQGLTDGMGMGVPDFSPRQMLDDLEQATGKEDMAMIDRVQRLVHDYESNAQKLAAALNRWCANCKLNIRVVVRNGQLDLKKSNLTTKSRSRKSFTIVVPAKDVRKSDKVLPPSTKLSAQQLDQIAKSLGKTNPQVMRRGLKAQAFFNLLKQENPFSKSGVKKTIKQAVNAAIR